MTFDSIRPPPSLFGFDYLPHKIIPNKTPAQAFTAPAEKKMDKKWTFMDNCTGRRKHEVHNIIFKVYIMKCIILLLFIYIIFKIFNVIKARTKDLSRKFLL